MNKFKYNDEYSIFETDFDFDNIKEEGIEFAKNEFINEMNNVMKDMDIYAIFEITNIEFLEIDKSNTAAYFKISYESNTNLDFL